MHVVWENAFIHINTLSINFNDAYMIWNLIGSIGGKVLDIVDNVVEEKDEANRLKFLLQMESLNESIRVYYRDLLTHFF